MSDVVVELRSLAESLKARSHPLVGHPTLTVSMISGGITTCMVPGSCRVTIDRRVLPGEHANELVEACCGLRKSVICPLLDELLHELAWLLISDGEVRHLQAAPASLALRERQVVTRPNSPMLAKMLL
jgi:acetylornithine deacetylase/succinyl-diaminopimelate desuccinylase-like protein